MSGNDDRLLADMQSKGAKIVRPNIGPWRDAVKPVYVKAKEKYGADVDAILADAEAVRKALARPEISRARHAAALAVPSPSPPSGRPPPIRALGVVVDWTIVAIGAA